MRAAAKVPWFRLRLPSGGPRFESQAHHIPGLFSVCIIEIVNDIGMGKGLK